jgi:Rps23 Pro-64 3,4-dihydroxylase Tpa1-like proline 4-hydroxylase
VSSQAPTGKTRFRFEPERLRGLADNNRQAYASADPFPHVVIDDFLPSEVLDELLAEFPAPQQADWQAFDSPTERKLAAEDDSVMGDATKHLLGELNSAAAIDFLERLTGIEGLVPDPHFVGGGLHQIERGGHLKVHVDFNRHPRTGLERRLNLLVYLNRDWREEYGGALELWSRGMRSCEARILPLFNRCVVFSTTAVSFHGHPEPLNCPEDRTRKSLALYYYSGDRAPLEQHDSHNTRWRARPGEAIPGHRPMLEFARLVTPPIVENIVRDAVRRRRARRP